MKAMVYQRAGRRAWTEVPDPILVEPTDVIVRVDTTTICGTNLHILKGDGRAAETKALEVAITRRRRSSSSTQHTQGKELRT